MKAQSKIISNYQFWDVTSIKQFWDSKSGKKEDYYSYKYGAQIIKYLERCGVLNSDGIKICDYGCGPGYLSEYLIERGYHVFGVDYSEESVSRLRSRLGGHPKFIGCSAIDSTDNISGAFDCVIVSEVIEHMYDNQLREMLEKVSSILKRGGVLVLTTPNEEILGKSVVYDKTMGKYIHKWQHVRSWSKISVEGWLNLSGFNVTSIQALDWRYIDVPIAFQLLGRLLTNRRLKMPNLVVVCRISE
jgi:2-polyprenyl-3-methyl-5-hydroxy-6-metoxy-1,4-benzoquinol methylase